MEELQTKVRYEQKFIDPELAGPNGYFTQRLINEIKWETVVWQRTNRPLPRKVFGCGADVYTAPEIVLELLEIVKNKYNVNISGCFLNLYEHKDHWLPFHKDSYNCDIYSLSFGATRKFLFQNTTSKETVEYILSGGDMIYFPEEVNKNWKHGIMKDKNDVGPRVNITIFVRN